MSMLDAGFMTVLRLDSTISSARSHAVSSSSGWYVTR